MKSLSVRLDGRLGNTLFQIAAAVVHAKRNGAELFVPGCSYFPWLDRTPEVLVRPYKEPSYAYRQLPFWDGMELVGYFQSELYFKGHATDVMNAFRYTPAVCEDLRGTVAVHVRRGDFLEADKHPVVSVDYLNAAWVHMSRLGFSRFHIYSDDPAWSEENVPFGDVMPMGEPWSDLVEMSRCGASIISNSSFSWWAAWLGEQNVHTPRPVYSPNHKNWVRGLNTTTIIPSRWTQHPA